MTVQVRRVVDDNGTVAYVIPEGYTAVLVPEEQAEHLAKWRECTAVRMPREVEGHVAFLEIEGTP